MRIPGGIIVLVVLCLLVSLALTYSRREDYSDESRLSRIWLIFEDYLSKTLLLIMVAAATIQVAVRFLLSDFITVSWTEELALLTLVWLSFWSAAAVSRRSDHVALTIVYDLLPPMGRRLMLIVGDIIIIAIMVPIAWTGFSNARWLDILQTVSLGVPVSTFAYSIPLTMALFAIHSLFHLIDHIRFGEPEKAAGDEAEAGP